jgi:hypothetical protein
MAKLSHAVREARTGTRVVGVAIDDDHAGVQRDGREGKVVR